MPAYKFTAEQIAEAERLRAVDTSIGKIAKTLKVSIGALDHARRIGLINIPFEKESGVKRRKAAARSSQPKKSMIDWTPLAGPALALRAKGLTVEAIAVELGVAHSSFQRARRLRIIELERLPRTRGKLLGCKTA